MSLTKKVRIDPAAVSPSDTNATPMASARSSLSAGVEALHPEISTILSRLGVEVLVCFHKLSSKERQHKKYRDDPEAIPTSARVNFTLTSSKMAETDEEFKRLTTETATAVSDFQKQLVFKF